VKCVENVAKYQTNDETDI